MLHNHISTITEKIVLLCVQFSGLNTPSTLPRIRVHKTRNILINLTRFQPCAELSTDKVTHTEYHARARHANVAWEIQSLSGECWIVMCTQHNWTSAYTSSIRSQRSNLLNGQHNLELRPANQSYMWYDKLFRLEHA